jgi:predicted RNA-binding protein YlxR (DUF448 family)
MSGRGQDGPRRTCVGCRTVRAQAELIRLAATAEGGIAVAVGESRGRGAYLCVAADCLERALKRRCLPQALRRPLPRLDAEELRRFVAARSERTLPTDPGPTDRANGKAAV